MKRRRSSRRTRGVGSCPCGKVRYRDRVAALMVLARIVAVDSPRRAKQEQRPYPCPLCHGWHLTSQPRRGRDTRTA